MSSFTTRVHIASLRRIVKPSPATMTTPLRRSLITMSIRRTISGIRHADKMRKDRDDLIQKRMGPLKVKEPQQGGI